MATPLWAAVWALAMQARGPQTTMPPPLYSLHDSIAFHPPSKMTGVGNDFAHVGLGSPDIAGFVAVLAGPLQISGLMPTGRRQGGMFIFLLFLFSP
jgi:hypothetical protein